MLVISIPISPEMPAAANAGGFYFAKILLLAMSKQYYYQNASISFPLDCTLTL